MKYKVVSATHISEFEAKVEAHLQDGWHLAGGASYDERHTIFMQAMHKGLVNESNAFQRYNLQEAEKADQKVLDQQPRDSKD